MGAGSNGSDEGYALSLDNAGDLRLAGSYYCGSSHPYFGDVQIPETGDEWDGFIAKLGEYIPQVPENLAISIIAGDAVLDWDPVTHTIFGQMMTPDEYIIQRSNSPDAGAFSELGRTTADIYTDENAGILNPRRFYCVEAYKY
jgi:hypothetical protein